MSSVSPTVPCPNCGAQPAEREGVRCGARSVALCITCGALLALATSGVRILSQEEESRLPPVVVNEAALLRGHLSSLARNPRLISGRPHGR